MSQTRRPHRRIRSIATPVASPFLQGVAEALLVPLAFVALGFGWWGTASGAFASAAPYSGSIVESLEMPASVDPREVWLVDGFNVVQVALLGGRDRTEWWTGPRRFELLARAEAFEGGDAEVWIVFDGDRPASPGDQAGRARPIFVPSADDWMVGQVRAAPDPSQITVVTADRRLAGRVRHHGGRVVTPAAFLERCPALLDRGETTPV